MVISPFGLLLQLYNRKDSNIEYKRFLKNMFLIEYPIDLEFLFLHKGYHEGSLRALLTPFGKIMDNSRRKVVKNTIMYSFHDDHLAAAIQAKKHVFAENLFVLTLLEQDQ